MIYKKIVQLPQRTISEPRKPDLVEYLNSQRITISESAAGMVPRCRNELTMMEKLQYAYSDEFEL